MFNDLIIIKHVPPVSASIFTVAIDISEFQPIK